MFLASRSPRTIIVTFARTSARFNAACPAALPAPTTATLSPEHWGSSPRPAPEGDALSRALGSFARTAPVVDAAVDQFVDTFHVEPSPIHPRRRDYDRG